MIDQILFNLIRYWRWLKSQPNIRRNIIFGLFLILSIFLTYKTINQIDRNYELEQEAIRLQQLVEDLTDKINQAQRRVDYLSSAYYSNWATTRRDEYRVKSGERVLALNVDNIEEQADNYTKVLPEEETKPEVSNFRKWWRFFTERRRGSQ